jgi:hypothetical protein
VADLLSELEQRILKPLENASAVRITDPEGTHLEFSLTAEEAKRWQMYAGMIPGHLLMEPLMSSSGEIRALAGDSVEAPPIFSNVHGVLAGTANHCGFFPRIEVYIEKARVVDVKGGGKYGDEIRELMDRYQHIQWPGYPDKGLFWFCDCALCTSVGAFRRKSDMFHSYWLYPNLPERTRAGVFHSGFGSRTYRGEDEFAAYASQHSLPRGHIHVHNYFATYEIKLRGTNLWHKIVDKGHITALSDPTLRAAAAKYGNPEGLLSCKWIPPLPGINCEGDYLQDYAPDPTAYLRKRLNEGHSI